MLNQENVSKHWKMTHGYWMWNVFNVQGLLLFIFIKWWIHCFWWIWWHSEGVECGHWNVHQGIQGTHIICMNDFEKWHWLFKVTCCCFSRSSTLILSASYDKTLKLWNWKTQDTSTLTFNGHTDTVSSVVNFLISQFLIERSCVAVFHHQNQQFSLVQMIGRLYFGMSIQETNCWHSLDIHTRYLSIWFDCHLFSAHRCGDVAFHPMDYTSCLYHQMSWKCGNLTLESVFTLKNSMEPAVQFLVMEPYWLLVDVKV